jgi:membrane protease subunit (stomatin/prohibitin family)
MVFGFIKGGVKELAIARPDAAKDQVVFQHPDPTIPNKAQLTVDADEVAVFFRDGKFVGQFGPGRHTLDADSIRFLGQLVDKFTDGNVYVAEVYFVTTRERTDVKFGGPIGKIRDAQSGLLAALMVHGTFSVRVIDPVKLVVGVAGLKKQDGDGFLTWFRQLTLKVLKDRIAELCVKQRWPLTDVTSGAYTREIEADAIAACRAEVDGYGLEVVRFGDFHIAMGAEDEAALGQFYQRAGYVNMAGGIAGYQQLAQADMMMKAGEGMAKGGGGGGALDGAGLGLGFAMAQQMMQGGRPGAAPEATPRIPPTGPATIACGGCGAQVNPGKFCPECGKALATGPKACGKCGAAVAGKFCAECGTPAG